MFRIFSNRRILTHVILIIASSLIISCVSLFIVYNKSILSLENNLIEILVIILLIFLSILLFVKIAGPLMQSIIENEKYYRNMFNNHHVYMLLIDPSNGNLVDANPAACEYYGYEHSEMVTMNIAQINALPAEEIEQKMKAAISGKESHFYFKHKLSNGIIRDVDVSSGIIGINGKELLYSIVYDITERIQSDIKRKASEEKFTTYIKDIEIQFVRKDGMVRDIILDEKKLSENEFLSFAKDISDRKLGEIQLKAQIDEFAALNEEYKTTIDELQYAKEVVEENEKKYKNSLTDLNKAQSTAKMGSWKWYIQEGRVIWSQGMYSIFGIPETEFNGNLDEIIQKMIHPDDKMKVEVSNNLVIENGIPLPLEYRILLNDGTVKTLWAEAGELIKDESDNSLILTGFVQDITEKKQIEGKVKGLSNIVKYSLNEIYIFDTNSLKYCFVNNSALSNLGYTTNEITKLSLIDIRPQFVWEEFYLTVNPLLKEEIEILIFESAHKRKDNTIYPVEVYLQLSEYEGEKRFVATVIDITVRKQSELDLIKAKEYAEESEIRFKALHNASFGGLIVHDKGKILECNQGLSEISGYSYQELIGMDGLLLIAKESREFVLNKIISKNEEPYDTIGLRKNGNEFPLRIEARNIPYKGKLVRSTEFRDITQQKQAELDIIAAKEKAEESDRLKTAFLQNMSHEIRTPMNAIMGFSDLLIDNYNNKSKLEKFSNIISQRCNDLLDIINDILDIAKIESGQVPINIEKCDLNDLFLELTSFFNEHHKKIGKPEIRFDLKSQCSMSENTILTDKVKLKQIFINLIGNAFKFTDKGSIEGGCMLDANNNLVFFVSDTGIGIPLEKQSYIFERFAQLEQTPNHFYGGTGLGLSIVKGLVDVLGGKIWLDSELNKGTTFNFYFPYRVIENVHHQNDLSAIKQEQNNFFNKTILIVEDDACNAEYIKEILKIAGFNTLLTDNGVGAIEISKSQKIDLVLMDIRLPDMNGYMATRQIKKYRPELKIIAQTAYAGIDDRERAIDSGCNDYISKPIKKELLLSLINKHLEEQLH